MPDKEYIVELREEEADELMDEHWVGELIRCKDCKHWKEGMCFDSVIPSPCPNKDWFCADGERRKAE